MSDANRNRRIVAQFDRVFGVGPRRIEIEDMGGGVIDVIIRRTDTDIVYRASDARLQFWSNDGWPQIHIT